MSCSLPLRPPSAPRAVGRRCEARCLPYSSTRLIWHGEAPTAPLALCWAPALLSRYLRHCHIRLGSLGHPQAHRDAHTRWRDAHGVGAGAPRERARRLWHGMVARREAWHAAEMVEMLLGSPCASPGQHAQQVGAGHEVHVDRAWWHAWVACRGLCPQHGRSTSRAEVTGKDGALRDSQTWELGDSLNGGVRSSHSRAGSLRSSLAVAACGFRVSTTVLAVGVLRVGVPSRT